MGNVYHRLFAFFFRAASIFVGDSIFGISYGIGRYLPRFPAGHISHLDERRGGGAPHNTLSIQIA